jgi:diguanylate cyclase (GGDEF)-like protein
VLEGPQWLSLATRRGQRTTDQIVTGLGVVAGLVLVTATVVAALNLGPDGSVPSSILILGMGLLFLALVARTVAASIAAPERRYAALSMALALVLWAIGSAQVNGSAGASTLTTFPAPGEWAFFASAAALAGCLFLDVAGRTRPSVTDWLEAVVASGGAVCTVALLVVTPIADDFARQGVPLLVALVYPVLDLILLAVVIAQVSLHKRAPSAGTAILMTGLVLLLTADFSGTVVYLARGTYAYGLVADVAWCLAWFLLADSVCRQRREPKAATQNSKSGGRVTVGAAGVAVGVLALQPGGAARAYVVIPAVVTILAAGVRLVLALSQARGAAEAYRLSRTDDLTGLPNRRAVIAELARRMTTDPSLTVVLLDLNGFKEINDSLGHSAGDSLLQIIARRLRHALPDDVMASRLGSDEFALLLTQEDPERVLDLTQEIRRLIRRPIHLDGLEITVDTSAGVATRSPEMSSKGDLLRCADVALIQAKRSGAGVLVYDPEQDEFSRARLALAEELRHGLEREQLVVWYQPQVETVTGQVLSVEALVRWMHPTQGLLAPFAFLGAARRAGLMARLTEVVLGIAMRDLAAWRVQGLDVSVAVNIAPPELLAGSMVHELGALLERERVPAERLIIEVTEDSFLADPDHARRVIHDLRQQGVQVSIDDYGTGFSSLAYLRDLPLQELKIDRSFVADILNDRRSWMIVNTTNQLAHGLGLRTVAEGVEDEQQLEELRAIGIDVLQGYHLARPMPGDHLVNWLRDRRREELSVRSA